MPLSQLRELGKPDQIAYVAVLHLADVKDPLRFRLCYERDAETIQFTDNFKNLGAVKVNSAVFVKPNNDRWLVKDRSTGQVTMAVHQELASYLPDAEEESSESCKSGLVARSVSRPPGFWLNSAINWCYIFGQLAGFLAVITAIVQAIRFLIFPDS